MGPILASHIWEDVAPLVGNRVFLFDELESTNSYAAAHASAANAGNVILARHQTAGRGQYSRSWISSMDAGVWLTVVLSPPEHARRPVVLAAWAAVSVCELIRECTGLTARIKWPNDVLIQGKKVAGILIESRVRPSTQIPLVFAGIGLNVYQPQSFFDANLLPDATSLACMAHVRERPDSIARKLIQTLDKHYASVQIWELEALEVAWRLHSELEGKQVMVKHAGRVTHGTLKSMSFDAIEISHDSRQVEKLLPEAIQQLLPATT